MADDDAPQDPQTSTGGSPGGSKATVVMLAALVGVALLVVGVLLGALLYGQGPSAPVATVVPKPAPVGSAAATENPMPNPATNPATNPSAAPEPVVDTVGVSDPDVTRWHAGVVRPIGLIVMTLSNPAPSTATEVRANCTMMKTAADELAGAPKAPQPDVEKTFRVWVKQVSKALKTCAKNTPGMSDEEYLQTTAATLSATGPAFDEFGKTLDQYFDFSTTQK